MEPLYAPIGEMLWSEYFGKWVIVVSYEDDDNWWFVIPGRRSMAMKAETPLSVLREMAGT